MKKHSTKLGFLGCLVVMALPYTAFAASDLRASDLRDRGAFISSDDVRRAGGRYTFKVPGKGEFRIESVSSQKGGRCLIDKKSLVEMVQRLNLRAPGPGQAGATTKIRLKANAPETEVGDIICSGDGTGCTVLIPVWDPDSPTLPGL